MVVFMAVTMTGMPVDRFGFAIRNITRAIIGSFMPSSWIVVLTPGPLSRDTDGDITPAGMKWFGGFLFAEGV